MSRYIISMHSITINLSSNIFKFVDVVTDDKMELKFDIDDFYFLLIDLNMAL